MWWKFSTTSCEESKMSEDFMFDPSHLLWVEKYRPARVRDCILVDSVKQTLQSFVDQKDCPNILASGSAGIGKTTFAKALAREMGADFIVINASDARGIDVLRSTITTFASTVSFDSESPIKIVILDEFDHATPIFQAALRGAMEEFAKTCRFILTCNFPNKIIDAIHSRCTNISLAIPKDEMPKVAKTFMGRLIQILEEEQIPVEKPALASLVKKYFPDFRRTINELQNIAQTTGKIDEVSVSASSGDQDITMYIRALKNKKFGDARQWIAANCHSDVQGLFRKIYDLAYELVEPQSIPNLILLIANYEYRAMSSVNPEINLAAFSVECMSEVTFK
jgi:replication factor C small subunit